MKAIALALALAALTITGRQAHAHCQIPCGIYNDDTVFSQLMTDVETLQKSVAVIEQLSGEDTPNPNQITRWVMNKEHHADHIMEQMLTYFLAQRIKADHGNYADELVATHKVITLSMKTKQTVDAEVVGQLKAALEELQKLYQANS